MSIYADPDGMREVILKCISKLRSKMAYIKAEYTNAVKCLQSEAGEFLQLEDMITEINRNIEYINRVLFNCERFIDDTILEYMSAQEKIMSIYNRFENAEILKGEKKYNISHSDGNANRTKRPLQKREVVLCKLPQKDSFINAPVRTGKIEDGNNIIIRTWSVSG